MKSTNTVKARLNFGINTAARAQDRKANLSLLIILPLGILAYFISNPAAAPEAAARTTPEAPRELTLAERVETIDYRTAQLEWVVDHPNTSAAVINRAKVPVRDLLNEVKTTSAEARAEGDTDSKETLANLRDRLTNLLSRSTTLASLN